MRGRPILATVLLIIHGLVAVALLGAITHQTLAAWAPVSARPGSFFGRFRTVPSGYVRQCRRRSVSRLRDPGRDHLSRLPHRREADARAGPATGRHSASSISRSISSPSVRPCCRPIGSAGGGRVTTRSDRTRAILTSIIAFIVWWGFLAGHVTNNIMGFGGCPRPVAGSPLHYGPAFAVLYVVALKLDLALFTVYPSLGVVVRARNHSRDTVDPSLGSFLPAMYWYGWATTAASGSAPHIWHWRRYLARALVTTVLVGLVVGTSRGSDDRMRLPHAALVSTLVANFSIDPNRT